LRNQEETHEHLPTPPPEPVRHGWADLLALVGAIRRIAYDVTLEAGDALRRIRDVYAEYDAGGVS
jgi:hypothetical protein